MHMTTHSGNDCSPETLVVQEVKEFATGDCIEESSFSYTYDCTTWQQGSGEGGGEKKKSTTTTPAANKKEPEKKDKMSQGNSKGVYSWSVAGLVVCLVVVSMLF